MKKLRPTSRLALDRETLRELDLKAGTWYPRDASWTCVEWCGAYPTAICN